MKFNKFEVRAMINKIKLDRGCETCGYNANAAALSFDHLDPSIKYRTKSGRAVHIADMTKGGANGSRYSMRTILAEIEKCRVLCANCHMEHTFPQSRSPYLEREENVQL